MSPCQKDIYVFLLANKLKWKESIFFLVGLIASVVFSITITSYELWFKDGFLFVLFSHSPPFIIILHSWKDYSDYSDLCCQEISFFMTLSKFVISFYPWINILFLSLLHILIYTWDKENRIITILSSLLSTISTNITFLFLIVNVNTSFEFFLFLLSQQALLSLILANKWCHLQITNC